MPAHPHWRVRLIFLLVLTGAGAGWWWQSRELGGRASRTALVVRVERQAEVAAPSGGREPREENVRVTELAPVTREAEAGALWTLVRLPPAEVERLNRALPAPSHAVHYVRANAELVRGKRSPFWQKPGEGRVMLPLPEGGALTIVIEASEMLGADRFTSTGHLDGRPRSRAVLAWSGGFLHATVEDAELGTHVLRVATAEFSQYYRVDPALVPGCGGERRAVIDDKVLTAARTRQARAKALAAGATAEAAAGSDTPTRPLAASRNPQAVEVQVMMAVTQDVLATVSGAARTAALQSAFDAAIAKVNLDLAASLITARVKLVRVAETTYNEQLSANNKVQDEALTALQADNDGKMDELHALRDACGADIVCLALNRADTASSGLAYVIDSPGATTNALFAFSVVQYAFVAGSTVVAHELGHSFGCAHDRENAFTPGAYTYSYGYRFFGADGVRYRDIMAYPPGVQLGYFSNPSVVLPEPISAALGIAEGRPGESDTARTIEQAAFEVSEYRLQTQTPPGAGSLINVATRATAGPGDRAVIAGFTVEGPQPKTMLVRAAGPALAAFGVRDALPAPVLELYSGATLLARTEDWSKQVAVAPLIIAASVRSGAFLFLNESADAALLISLAPGAYTAVVRSPDVTGSVLVEAYEAGAEANRLVNLSTRAFADNVGHPLVAGFVVRGAPDATKRVLVRALGPSLGRAPLSLANAMNDPVMEIRDARGALVLRGDDWSTGADGSSGVTDDFKPLVRFYNEQQIAATGLAPANRREPCLLADLPPGNYTVTVFPYEALPDEPAVAGVALVEVFELKR